MMNRLVLTTEHRRSARYWVAAAMIALAPVGANAADAAAPTTAPTAAETVAAADPDLQKAVDYQLPENKCTAPVVRNSNQNAGAVEKLQRAQKRYIECVSTYQKGLLADLHSITDAGKKAEAAKQLSNEQAAAIKRHMEMIGTTIKALKGA